MSRTPRHSDEKRHAAGTDEERRAYANVLRVGVPLAAAVLAVTFSLYLAEVIPARVPPDQLPAHWSRSSEAYLDAADVSPGWGWTAHAGRADYLNYVGICLLAALPALAYLRMLTTLCRRRRWLLAAIVAANLLVITLAASGVTTR